MKKYSFIIIIILCIAAFVFIDVKIGVTGLFETMSPEELKASIEVVEVETKWVDKQYEPWPPKLILVPALSFKVKNITDKPLRYINFNANFRFRDDYENLGDCYLAAIRGEPIMPGETSDLILLKSNFGIEGKSLASFKNSPHWKIAIVKLFAQSKGSQLKLIGEWEVSKKIDFKEPELKVLKKIQEERARKAKEKKK